MSPLAECSWHPDDDASVRETPPLLERTCAAAKPAAMRHARARAPRTPARLRIRVMLSSPWIDRRNRNAVRLLMGRRPANGRLRSGEAEAFVHQFDRWRRRLTRLLCADLEQPVEFADVRAKLLVTRLDRGQHLDDRFRDVLFEAAVAGTVVA